MLTHDHDIDATNIEIQVRDGEVILSGHVTERGMKRSAEEVAERVSGVKDVQNQIKVQSESDQKGGMKKQDGANATDAVQRRTGKESS
jgi:hypothetical protein